jgi:hypothetical protein
VAGRAAVDVAPVAHAAVLLRQAGVPVGRGDAQHRRAAVGGVRRGVMAPSILAAQRRRHPGP